MSTKGFTFVYILFTPPIDHPPRATFTLSTAFLTIGIVNQIYITKNEDNINIGFLLHLNLYLSYLKLYSNNEIYYTAKPDYSKLNLQSMEK